jgi:type II secretory pathway predicted ATPase ExeA
MGYEQFFGLTDAPFSLAPDPRYLFDSESHAQALRQLALAIDLREPLVVVTGEIGTGKTLLCRAMLERLGPRTFISVINDPLLDRDDFLKQMLQDFGVLSTDRTIVPTPSRHDLVHALEDFLSSLIALDAHGVVLIDEAQHVQPDVLEQIRLLSNIDAPTGTRLQILLVGQPSLEALLARPDLRQFQQRVTRRIHLEPLAESELKPYIEHRLTVGRTTGSGLIGANELARAIAQWTGDGATVTFSPDAISAVWRASGGLPRLVNVICDGALEAAHDQGVRTIDAGLVEAGAARRLPPPAKIESPTPLDQPASPTPLEPSASLVPHALPTPVVLPASVEPSLSPAPIVPPAGLTPIELFEPDALMSPDVDARAASILTPMESSPKSGRPWKLVAALFVLLAGAAVAFWFGQRAPASPRAMAPAPSSGSGSAAVAPGSSAVPAPANAPPQEPPVAAAPARVPSPAAAPEPAPAAPAERNQTGGAFEIVVASFRTEARATSVAAQVSAAGLAVRQRAVGEWQQVIAGPFASREEAAGAQQRLERAGLSGTNIVSTKP